MTDQPDSKTCLACRQLFYRRPAPLDSAFRWMRRKFCSGACYRAMPKAARRPAAAAGQRANGGR